MINVMIVDSTMARFFLLWSTIVSNTIVKIATSSMYEPPIIPVANTDFVSRYTQNVSANHKKLVVTFAISVLIKT
ncbi:hypothetical protein D3C85_1808350 [compost metagenome]